jgi:hypothetical protein
VLNTEISKIYGEKSSARDKIEGEDLFNGKWSSPRCQAECNLLPAGDGVLSGFFCTLCMTRSLDVRTCKPEKCWNMQHGSWNAQWHMLESYNICPVIKRCFIFVKHCLSQWLPILHQHRTLPCGWKKFLHNISGDVHVDYIELICMISWTIPLSNFTRWQS